MVLNTIEGDLKQAGFPPLAWYDVLLEVRNGGTSGVRPKDLQEQLLLAQYNLSRLVDRIENNGYIVKAQSPDDGRGSVLTISQTGRGLIDRMWPVYAAALQHAIGERVTDAEAATLAALLESIRSV
ncbi:MAG: MarR family winged helix-turn-helix transcriptional regulator [Proteobacteria bacterium]|nr:MarR family winged helix-turn-helix transcriptional regulator [Pseudomonadota bacterium]